VFSHRCGSCIYAVLADDVLRNAFLDLCESFARLHGYGRVLFFPDFSSSQPQCLRLCTTLFKEKRLAPLRFSAFCIRDQSFSIFPMQASIYLLFLIWGRINPDGHRQWPKRHACCSPVCRSPLVRKDSFFLDSCSLPVSTINLAQFSRGFQSRYHLHLVTFHTSPEFCCD